MSGQSGEWGGEKQCAALKMGTSRESTGALASHGGLVKRKR